jgi:hypothetical protein
MEVFPVPHLPNSPTVNVSEPLRLSNVLDNNLAKNALSSRSSECFSIGLSE